MFTHKKMSMKPSSYHLVIYCPRHLSLTLWSDVFTWVTMVLPLNVFRIGIWSSACSVTQRGNMQIMIWGAEKIAQKGKVMLIEKNTQIHNCVKKAVQSAYLFSHPAAYYCREDKICFLNRQSQNTFLFLLHNRCYLETRKFINSWKVTVLDITIRKTWTQMYHCSVWY